MKYKIIVNDKSIYESYYAVNPNMRILKKGFTIFLLVIIGLAIAFHDVERIVSYTFCMCISQVVFYCVRKRDCKNLMEKFYNGTIAIDRADLQKQSEDMLIKVVREKMPQVKLRGIRKKSEV